MKAPVTFDEDGWPIWMPRLTADDFSIGSWSKPHISLYHYSIHTLQEAPHCLCPVAWVRVAFGLPPIQISCEPPNASTFLRVFNKHLGFDDAASEDRCPEPFNNWGDCTIDRVDDGCSMVPPHASHSLTTSQLADAWAKTLQELGYEDTEEEYIAW